MKNIITALTLACTLSGITYAEQTDDSKGAITLRAGTYGAGIEYITPVDEKLNLRFGLYGVKTTRKETIDGIKYDAKPKLFMTGVLADYHPWAKSFRVTAGLLYNTNKVIVDALSEQNLNIGDKTYTPEEVGSLQGVLETNKIAPYLGIGWGNIIKSESRYNLMVDLGVMFHGTPKANLEANIPADSPLNLDPDKRAEFDQNLKKELDSVRDEISGYYVYPFVSVGLGIKF